MPEHSTIAHADTHEPKHITTGVVGDSGKIITNSSSVSGTSEYRAIVEGDINDIANIYTVDMEDISTVGSSWVVVRRSGTIEKFNIVIDGAIITSDCQITLKIGGVDVTNGAPIITVAGSGPGDVTTATPTGANTVLAGTPIEIASNGASTNTVKAVFTLEIKRT